MADDGAERDGRVLVEECKRLLRMTVRIFYDDTCVMLVDILLDAQEWCVVDRKTILSPLKLCRFGLSFQNRYN